MNDMKLFDFQGNQVRTLMIENEPWFVGKDVTNVLGYQNSSKALIDHVEDEDKLNNESLSSLGQRGGWLINESGVYALIFSSKLPRAKTFKRWVTSEVLPTLRKTGKYTMYDEEVVEEEPSQWSKIERAYSMVMNLPADKQALFSYMIGFDKSHEDKHYSPDLKAESHAFKYIKSLNAYVDLRNETSRDVYKKYYDYAIENGHEPIAKIEFSKLVKKIHGYITKVVRINKKCVRIYVEMN